ncbi:MAG TPA: tetratricopeptide repeat protein [Chryseolinea sp.]|nr:tetratricopeptide repeat protein [Chryseolinea sp.]
MKNIRVHRALTLMVVLLMTVPLSLHAQRKKKDTGDVFASGLKLREAEFYFTEGEKFFILEDYAKALLYYQRALEITPDNATIHYKIAEVLSRSNKQEELLKASFSIENALKLEKKNKYFYLLAANIYGSLTRFDKAAATYETLVQEVPGTEEYLYELAAVYQYANKFDDAVKTYNRAENILGVSEVSSVQKMRILIEQGKMKEGIAEGEKLINAFPGEERYIMAFAEILSQKGYRNDAIKSLEKFTAENKDVGNAEMLLAGMYRDNNQEEKARPLLLKLFEDNSIEASSKVIILASYNAELNQNKAKKISDPDKENFALSLFEKLEKASPENPNVHIIGGDLYLATGKTREAVKEYVIAVESSDVNYEVWQNLIYLEVQLESFDDVIKHSDDALELFPNQGMLYYFNGFAHLRKRQYQEAIGSLEQAKKIAKADSNFMSDVSNMLGDAYNATKAYEKSDKAFDEALTLNPVNNSALNNYSYYLALRKTNLEKAEKMSAQLTKNNPDNPTFLDTYAWVLYTREKYKEARKVIERAITTGNANATHFEHYGDILFKLGDVNGAVEQWQKARGMNANSESLNKKIANRKMYE